MVHNSFPHKTQEESQAIFQCLVKLLGDGRTLKVDDIQKDSKFGGNAKISFQERLFWT